MEDELYKTKWFDYRMLSPDMATMRFVYFWMKSHGWALSHAGLDFREDLNGDPVPVPYHYAQGTMEYFQQVNDGEDWEAFQKLRRMCDRRGVPYWMFCESAIKVLQGTDEGVLDVRCTTGNMMLNSIMLDVTERKLHGPIPLARDPHFAAAAYVGHPLQEEYAWHVTRAIKSRYRGDLTQKFVSLIKNGHLSKQFVKKLLTHKTERVCFR